MRSARRATKYRSPLQKGEEDVYEGREAYTALFGNDYGTMVRDGSSVVRRSVGETDVANFFPRADGLAEGALSL